MFRHFRATRLGLMKKCYLPCRRFPLKGSWAWDTFNVLLLLLFLSLHVYCRPVPPPLSTNAFPLETPCCLCSDPLELMRPLHSAHAQYPPAVHHSTVNRRAKHTLYGVVFTVFYSWWCCVKSCWWSHILIKNVRFYRLLQVRVVPEKSI